MTQSRNTYTEPKIEIITLSSGNIMLADSNSPSSGYENNDLGNLE
ncbi:MAG: hypothetical protein ACI395_06650 [Candidatus Cryptobacteroides sp.]